MESHPAGWDSYNVVGWARRIGLSEQTILALTENEVDGPTLVTLRRDDLRTKLGITSLPARRYLWSLIEQLRAHQEASDRSSAVDVLEEELTSLSLRESADASAGGTRLNPTAVELLHNNAHAQRQILSDHLLALRLQSFGGQQVYKDAELARNENERLRQLAVQSEFDARYARSLDQRRRGRARSEASDDRSEVASLFGLTIQTCVSNKINVAEALQDGTIKVIPRLNELDLNDLDDDLTVDPEVTLGGLPDIPTCNVCYEQGVKGIVLACDHCMCVDCTRSLFIAALDDSSLLPLRCCEVPIDMNIAKWILEPNDARKMNSRLVEMAAKNKMYCPNCSKFINLDLIDTTGGSKDLVCVCGTALCVVCKTVSHPNISCAENKANVQGKDRRLIEEAVARGWKQCPNCSVVIELAHGCNHVTCAICDHEFCFRCLAPWNGNVCSTGRCDVWDEANLIAGAEARVEAEENRIRRELPAPARRQRLQQEMRALRANEGCYHEWERVNGNLGNCERCDYYLPCYGMRCANECGLTVCYICANHRIPRRGWR